PRGKVPNAANAMVTGPGVRSVSPPRSGQPYRSASEARPRLKASSQSAPMSVGKASERRNPAGVAPLAARSERFTRNALRATASAGSSIKKCTLPTIASVFSTRSLPSGGVSTAASSIRAKAPGCRASGRKYLAIRRSSAVSAGALAMVSNLAAELRGSQLARQLIEHGVDHAGLVFFHKGMRDIDIFGNDDPRRHILTAFQLVGAGPQRRAQHSLDARERPPLRQHAIDHRIEAALLAHDAADDVAEERRFRGKILLTFHFAADPMALELGEDFVQRRRCHVHLVERLHRGKARRSAPIGLALVLWGGGGHGITPRPRGA